MNALILATLVSVGSCRTGTEDDAPRLDPAERAHLMATTPARNWKLGGALERIERAGATVVDVPEAAKPLTLHWMGRMFRPDVLPPQTQMRWYGTSYLNKLGLWEQVNSVFQVGGRKALWADGFSDEDPRTVNPMWLWVELHEGEMDTSSEASTKRGAEQLLRTWFRLHDEGAPIRMLTVYGGEDEFGYWVFEASQPQSDVMPSECGWMERMMVATNGRHLFLTVWYCVDSTYPWKGRGEYFNADAAYRKLSRFTGEPIKYDTVFTDRSRHNRGK